MFSISDIRKALYTDQFIPFCQPIMDAKSSRITGCEILARWQHPKNGLLCANEFILNLEEDMSLLEKMTRSLLESAIVNFCTLNHHHRSGLMISLNVSISLLLRKSFTHYLKHARELLMRFGISLALEITEREDISLLPEAPGVLADLSREGMCFFVDDFQCRPCDVDLLTASRASVVKLDRSIVSIATAGCISGKYISDIISFLHNKGVVVLAEGIETQNHADYFRHQGVELLQGYYCGSPVPFESFSYCLKMNQK